MDKPSFFILNIFLNSFLSFFTAVFLIKGTIFLFRIQPGRLKALLKMIPILKLPLDLCLYDFSRWSYAQGINPLLCEKGTRTLSIILKGSYSGIQFTVPGSLTFTLADVLGHAAPLLILKVFSILLPSFSCAFLIRKFFLYYRSKRALNSLAKSSRPLHRKIRNPALSLCFKKYSIKILTSQTLSGSPFVTELNSVYISENLSQHLSRKEYAAVLAHELEHVLYKDGLVRLILDLIATLFWWIPTKWLRNRIEEEQEVGCDFKCKKYGIESIDLASAICKSAKHSNAHNHLFTHHLTKLTIRKRVNILLTPASIRFKKTRFAFSCLALGISFLMILLGRFWMF